MPENDDLLKKLEDLWRQKLHDAVVGLHGMPDEKVEDYLFESWSEAILSLYSSIDPNFKKNWDKVSRATKEKAILPGRFADKSFVYFRQVVLGAVISVLSRSAAPNRGKA